MRLTNQQRQAIKEVIARHDCEAKVYLFGSRIDDNSRGGDIDLLILSATLTDRDRRGLRMELFEQLGEQKIDTIIANDLSQPFVRLAFQQGLLL